ncbi:MAG: hypothetical protein ISS01_01115 [Nanoarchaeota archaeon]|nr:hypothetical protein [Nanoarchaeota archaeon]
MAKDKSSAKMYDDSGNEFAVKADTPMFKGKYRMVINFPTKDAGLQTKEIILNLAKGPTATSGFKFTVITNISGDTYYQGDLVELRWTTSPINPATIVFVLMKNGPASTGAESEILVSEAGDTNIFGSLSSIKLRMPTGVDSNNCFIRAYAYDSSRNPILGDYTEATANRSGGPFSIIPRGTTPTPPGPGPTPTPPGPGPTPTPPGPTPTPPGPGPGPTPTPPGPGPTPTPPGPGPTPTPPGPGPTPTPPGPGPSPTPPGYIGPGRQINVVEDLTELDQQLKLIKAELRKMRIPAKRAFFSRKISVATFLDTLMNSSELNKYFRIYRRMSEVASIMNKNTEIENKIGKSLYDDFFGSFSRLQDLVKGIDGLQNNRSVKQRFKELVNEFLKVARMGKGPLVEDFKKVHRLEQSRIRTLNANIIIRRVEYLEWFLSNAGRVDDVLKQEGKGLFSLVAMREFLREKAKSAFEFYQELQRMRRIIRKVVKKIEE